MKFFDKLYEPVSKVAKQLGVDPSLILGVPALESTWGEHPIGQNNYFGFTPHGDSTRGPDFPSLDAAWQAWANQFGSRVAGMGSDKNAFVNALLQNNQNVPGTDGRPPYNSEDSRWGDKLHGAIDAVQKRLPHWM